MSRKLLMAFSVSLLLALICGGLAPASTPRATAQPAPSATCPAELVFGEVFDCGISAAGEVDSYSFSGSINDKVFISILRVSGALNPYISLRKPGGDQECATYTYGDQISKLCTLTASGAITFTVGDTGGTNSGDYKVFAQRLNNPGNAQTGTFGPAVTGSISAVIQANTYRFSAKRNDIIRLRLLRTAGELDPYFSLYNSQGTLVNDCSSYSYGDLARAQCSLSADGDYTLLVGDTGEDHAGDYALHVQRLNNPGGATGLAFGVPQRKGIDAGAEMDTYSLEVATNDLLMIRLTQLSGDLDPQFELFNSAGTAVCDGYSYGAYTLDDACAINAAGRYTLIVEDTTDTNTGDYLLAVQRLNNPGETTALTFDQTAAGSIDAVAAFRTFSFTGQQDDTIKLVSQRGAGTFGAWLRLYTPGGTIRCQTYNRTATVTLSDCTLPASGQYTVVVADSDYTLVGDFTLTLTCTGGPCQRAGKERVYLPLVRKPR